MKLFHTSGIDAMRQEEADDTLAKGFGLSAPELATQLLRLRGKGIEHIQTEHQKVFAQADNLFLVDDNKI